VEEEKVERKENGGSIYHVNRNRNRKGKIERCLSLQPPLTVPLAHGLYLGGLFPNICG
jgi:hypothetical protein